MDHTVTRAVCDAPGFPGSYEEPDSAPNDDYYNPAGGIVIPRFQNMGAGKEVDFLRGFGFQGLGARFPVPEGEPAAFALGGTGEMLPMYDNRITLHPRRKDAWGVPIAHIRCAIGDNDRLIIQHQMIALREMLEHAGYRIHFLGSILGLDPSYRWGNLNPIQRVIFPIGIRMVMRLGQGIHECGGARMGDDPATSVLNSVNQAWDAPNLFIPDASSFASNSTVGPSLTIMALAARAAAYAAEAHANGDLRTPTQAA
jgi:choline dehydrogenase-like flavoprotein